MSVSRAPLMQANHDIAITGIYHGLATDHNALVDYVEKLQAEQRKRLGAD